MFPLRGHCCLYVHSQLITLHYIKILLRRRCTESARSANKMLVVGSGTLACKFGFYRAMQRIRGTSHGPVSVRLSVCPSVTCRCSTKTAKRRITQTTSHDSPKSLVFCCQRSLRNSTGVTPYEGAECRWGGSKSATFDQ